MIELRYKRMHVYRVSRTRDLYSKRTRIYIYGSEQGGACVRDKNPNLAPEEGGRLFEGGV